MSLINGPYTARTNRLTSLRANLDDFDHLFCEAPRVSLIGSYRPKATAGFQAQLDRTTTSGSSPSFHKNQLGARCRQPFSCVVPSERNSGPITNVAEKLFQRYKTVTKSESHTQTETGFIRPA